MSGGAKTPCTCAPIATPQGPIFFFFCDRGASGVVFATTYEIAMVERSPGAVAKCNDSPAPGQRAATRGRLVSVSGTNHRDDSASGPHVKNSLDPGLNSPEWGGRATSKTAQPGRHASGPKRSTSFRASAPIVEDLSRVLLDPVVDRATKGAQRPRP